ncbi:KamA family radical SAM protein [Candidatus Woesearchaeota archaeon]|nr:KamA family radical SAM protein [Candidatus Woesearchaeota archaeon]
MSDTKMNTNEFLKQFPERLKHIEKVCKVYPMQISEYYLKLIKNKDDPIWKQCIPDIREIEDEVNEEDPLLEEQYTPVPGLIHRYPDRALLLANNKCAMYCRFCTRKRKVGKDITITKNMIIGALQYISKHKEIRDVIVSGGDPLMMSDDGLEFILRSLREIKHVEIIRIGTRVPGVIPSRITSTLCNMMKKYHPIYINLHFEHPMEITEESKKACNMLADSGFPLGSQTVLLKGINDNEEVMKELFQKLMAMRIKPYYLYQADMVKGTEHFRTPVTKGLEIIKSLQGHTSGLAIPQYIIDTPGGGKIPLIPDYIKFKNNEKIIMENFENKIVEYYEPKSSGRKKNNKFKIAVVFNLKKQSEKNKPEDYYAEFDNIEVPIAIQKALIKLTDNVDLLESDNNLFEKLKKGKYNFVFNIAEGLLGESRESHVPAILEMLGIPYSGSGVCTQAITLDKRRKKEILGFHNIPTPRFQIMNSPIEKLSQHLTYPLFVKPNCEGSSKGIRNNSIVHNKDELMKVVMKIIEVYNQPALIEEFLPGREFTVSILGNNPPVVLPIVEIKFDYLPSGINNIDSYEVKWYWDNPKTAKKAVQCPAKIDEKLEKQIKNIALKTYSALGCVDFTRMDLRLDAHGIPNVIDVNALPGLMPDPKENSRFPKSCYTLGMTFEEIIYKILFSAMERYGLLEKYNFPSEKVKCFVKIKTERL